MTDAARTSGAPVVHCASLSVNRGKRRVLDDVSLSIHAGECVALIGPNGSGKTTLMLAILGLLPAASGGVRLNGQALSALSARARGRIASYVPQAIEHVPALTVHEWVATGRYVHLGPLMPLMDADRRIVDAALRQCRLLDLAARPVAALSGGERQKTLIAAAIAQDTPLMCLDEPNTALDPAYQVELVSLLREWHRRGRTLLIISHDLQLPAALEQRVVALRAGRVVADGSAADVLQPDRLSAIYGTGFTSAETQRGRKVILPDWWTAPGPDQMLTPAPSVRDRALPPRETGA